MRWPSDSQGNSHSQYFLYGGDEFYEPTAKKMFTEMNQDAYFMVAPHHERTDNRNGMTQNVMDHLPRFVTSPKIKPWSLGF